MAQVEIKNMTPEQNDESDDAFVLQLGPIPTDKDGNPLYTKREWRDECIFNFVKMIVVQARTVIGEKSKTPYSIEVETEYGKIEK